MIETLWRAAFVLLAVGFIFAAPATLVTADYIACTSIKGNSYGGFPPHCIWPPLFTEPKP